MTYAFDLPRLAAAVPTASRTVTPPATPNEARSLSTRQDDLPCGRPDDDRDATSDIVWTLAYWPWL